MMIHLKKVTVMFLILTAIMTLAEDFFYRLSPQSHWYEYYEVIPIRDGDDIVFSSRAEIKREVRFVWYDSLHCSKDGNNFTKYITQVWEDTAKKSVFDDSSRWIYNHFPKERNMICRMCGNIEGYTPSTIFRPSGYIKKDSYCTEDFIY